VLIRAPVAILKKEKIMNVNLNRTIKPISLSIVLLLLLGFQFKESQAQETSLAKATFYVY